MHEILMSGFGGQGVLSMGVLLTHAGMLERKQVSWMPAYGAEMRGGTANCSVVLSDDPIGSPVVVEPTIFVAMNAPSLERFIGQVATGGLVLVNSSMIDIEVERDDVKVIKVPANKVASDLGSERVANMVLLGALVEATGVVKPASLVESLKVALPAHRHNLIPANEKALEKGAKYAKQ